MREDAEARRPHTWEVSPMDALSKEGLYSCLIQLPPHDAALKHDDGNIQLLH